MTDTKQTQLVGFFLIASACLLAAALVMNLQNRGISLDSTARAEMVTSTNSLSFLTTRTNANEECLFVVDNVTQKMLIYRLDIAKKRLELAGVEDLKKVFAVKAGG
jgi:hypothetical protein